MLAGKVKDGLFTLIFQNVLGVLFIFAKKHLFLRFWDDRWLLWTRNRP